MAVDDVSPTGKPVFKLPAWAIVLLVTLGGAAAALNQIEELPEWLRNTAGIVAFVSTTAIGLSPGLRKRQ